MRNRIFCALAGAMFTMMTLALFSFSVSEAEAQVKTMRDPEVVTDKAAAARKKILMLPDSKAMTEQAPDVFRVLLETTKGDVIIEARRELSPRGVDRFYNLVRHGFYDEVRFFRVISGFMAQFGINADPSISAKWMDAGIPDEPSKASNTRGMVTFAKRGSPNSRTTQLFINFGNNSFLDPQGFAPFGEVIEGMDVVDSFYAEYGEGAPNGRGPDQMRMQREGNAYLEASFDKLDFIKTATILEGEAESDAQEDDGK